VTSPVPRVKEPHLAGRLYPAAADRLREAVGALLAAAGPSRAGVRAVLVPHGALEQSGAVAARGLAAAGGDRRRVVVLAPAHHANFRGASVLAMDAYRTPLGLVGIDAAAAAAVVAPPLVRSNPAVFMREPGIEIQLPLLQALGVRAGLVPVLIGVLEAGEAGAVAAALRAVVDEGTLVVASADLVQYGRRFGFLPVPPTDRAAVAAAVARLDEEALAHVVAADADAFARWVAESGASVCGRHVIEVLLRLLPAGARGERLAHATSLDAGDDAEHVVGFAAVGFTA
jgi:AmmeMemoRadiSam system protein B